MLLTWIVLGIIVLVIIWIVAIFNSLVSKNNRVKNAWSDIDVQLKRRYDLIPNLVSTVKGYRDYEASLLEKVTLARTSAMTAPTLSGKAEAENSLSMALKNLFAVAENYPELHASENFRNLQTELSNLENDIQSARRYYNAAVRELNIAIQKFPQNIVANTFGYKQNEFFGAEEGERSSVNVSL